MTRDYEGEREGGGPGENTPGEGFRRAGSDSDAGDRADDMRDEATSRPEGTRDDVADRAEREDISGRGEEDVGGRSQDRGGGGVREEAGVAAGAGAAAAATREGGAPGGTEGRPAARSSGLYNLEHMLAWLMAIGAIVLAALGALASFDIVDFRDEAGIAGEAADASAISNFQDGVLLLLPAIAAALLAMTWHNTEHHRAVRSPEQPGLWSVEHWLAYLGAAATIAFGVLSVLIGFDVFDSDNTWRDGATWGLLSIFSGVLTYTLHHVEHHAFVVGAEGAEVRRMLEERMGGRDIPGAEPGRAPESAAGRITGRR
jgi:hypothetical protein